MMPDVGKERARKVVLILEALSCTRMKKNTRPVGGTKDYIWNH